MNKTRKHEMSLRWILIASTVAFALGFFYNMSKTIIELNHRVDVLEDQIETTMNILTDDGHGVVGE